jgi:hypothetical protein
MNEITRSDFKLLVAKANAIYVSVLSESGPCYFEITKDVAALKVADVENYGLRFEMDSDYFLWIGDPEAPLTVVD